MQPRRGLVELNRQVRGGFLGALGSISRPSALSCVWPIWRVMWELEFLRCGRFRLRLSPLSIFLGLANLEGNVGARAFALREV